MCVLLVDSALIQYLIGFYIKNIYRYIQIIQSGSNEIHEKRYRRR